MRSMTLSIIYAYLGGWSCFRRPRPEQVHARYVLEELVQRSSRVTTEEVELVDEDLGRLVRYGGCRERCGLIREEVAVIRGRQLCSKVYAEDIISVALLSYDSRYSVPSIVSH